MLRVHKFRLGAYGDNLVRMTTGAKIVHVHEQDNVPHFWAVVDDTVETDEPKWFYVALTNQPIPTQYRTHIGTVHTNEGTFVLHVFGE